MKGISLRDLEAIRLLAMRRNFRAAALELGVSPPTLSHMIAAIEARLGIRLFNRTTRSVAPTQAGEALVEATASALSSIAGALEILDGFRATASGTIRLNASEVAAARLLPVIADFMREYPAISVEIASDGLLSDIVADGYDAGLRLAEAVPQDMIALPLSDDEQLIVVGSPDYLERHGAPTRPQDLTDHDCIIARLPSGRAMAWEFESEGAGFTIAVRGRLQLGSVELALQAAAMGLGLAYVGAWQARDAIRDGGLVDLLAAWTPPFPGLRLYYPRQRHHSAAFRSLLDYLQTRRSRI